MATISAGEAYLSLLQLLRECDLGWVVSQVQEQVRTGKPTLKSVATQTDIERGHFLIESENFQTKSGRRQRLAGTEDYTDVERIEIAITAIESAILQTTEMEESILEFLNSTEEKVLEVIFEPDEFEEAERFAIRTPSNDRRESTRQLEIAICKLREVTRHAD